MADHNDDDMTDLYQRKPRPSAPDAPQPSGAKVVDLARLREIAKERGTEATRWVLDRTWRIAAVAGFAGLVLGIIAGGSQAREVAIPGPTVTVTTPGPKITVNRQGPIVKITETETVTVAPKGPTGKATTITNGT